MNYYTVRDIALLLYVDCETVRRWIRSGKLKSTMTSRKHGNAVSEQELFEFADQNPGYAEMLGMTIPRFSPGRVKLLRELGALTAKRDKLNERINAIKALLEEEP